MVVENTKLVRDYVNPSRLPDWDYVINPYTGCTYKCTYCCAEFMQRFSRHHEDWGNFIDAKIATRDINLIKIDGGRIIMSSVTDPYNPYEERYNVTRTILEQLKNANISLHIVTKSNLVLRDLELLKQLKNVSVVFSIATTDKNFRKDIEPFAPSFQDRLNAIKILRNEGINTIAYISPIFPELTNYKEIIELTKDYVSEYWLENLNLRGSYRPRILAYINEQHPLYFNLYKEIYRLKTSNYWAEKEKEICEYLKERNIKYRNYFYHEKNRKSYK